jgi:hypothetical protein
MKVILAFSGHWEKKLLHELWFAIFERLNRINQDQSFAFEPLEEVYIQSLTDATFRHLCQDRESNAASREIRCWEGFSKGLISICHSTRKPNRKQLKSILEDNAVSKAEFRILLDNLRKGVRADVSAVALRLLPRLVYPDLAILELRTWSKVVEKPFLKTCLGCERFFYASSRDQRSRVCSDRCRHKYHNRQKDKKEWAKYMRENRYKYKLKAYYSDSD